VLTFSSIEFGRPRLALLSQVSSHGGDSLLGSTGSLGSKLAKMTQVFLDFPGQNSWTQKPRSGGFGILPDSDHEYITSISRFQFFHVHFDCFASPMVEHVSI